MLGKKRIPNIELTFPKTKLRIEDRVQPPALIQNISWTPLWPETSHDGKTTWDTAEERPSFQHYCLMGTKGSFTHWHIDLGGTTVWYHIHRGKKVFLLVPPTSKNLKLYKGKKKFRNFWKVASCRWSSFLYCQMRTMDLMTIGMTHPSVVG